MIDWRTCELDPVPILRRGVLEPEEHDQIVPGFVNFNPATGSTQGLPSGLGFQNWRVRLRGPKVISESSQEIFKSLDKDGQINPVLLWARNGRIWSSYGGTRVLWAVQGKHPLKCLIVDYDGAYADWDKVEYSEILNEFQIPPIGIVPLAFNWANGQHYMICDSREWELMTEEELIKAKEAAKPKRRRGRPRKDAA
jgi:hypothetical protein